MDSNRPRLATLLLVPVLALIGLGLFTVNYDVLASETAIGVFATMLGAGVLGLLAFALGGARRPSDTTAQISIPGLLRVLPKTDVTVEQWWSLMDEARHEFFLAGHSLGKWCGGTHAELFESNIIRILKGRGTVTLLTLAPGSPHLPRLQRATGRDYTKAVEESREFLRNLLSRLDAEHRQGLGIWVLPDHATLPYTVVGNEHTLLTATYLSSRDRDEVPCLEIARKSGAAISIYDDFCLLVKQGEPFDGV
jgi:hypothetical protein